MNVCKDLKPQKVFQFFEEICSIPHGSRNTKQISDYCAAFAKERKLTYYQDENNNIIILKPGTPGYESSEPVIIQGHMDMVCEKEADREIDFAKEGLSLYVDGDFLRARGTTLGGDDGIAIAYAFAILDSDDLPHPPLEVVITVDEEIGMLGAESIDVSMLKGRRMLNIDSDVEGSFLISCAGGLRADCRIPVSFCEIEGIQYELTLHGLLGGHSGGEINKERANAIVVSGRILKALQDEIGIRLTDLRGGLMDNAIPREVTMTLAVPEERKEALAKAVEKWDGILKKEYQTSDPDITLSLKAVGSGSVQALDRSSMVKVLLFLRNIPHGIQNMSMDIPGLVETSLNPGIMKLVKAEAADTGTASSGAEAEVVQETPYFQVSFSVRSSVTSRKYDVTDQLIFLTEFLGGEVGISGDYPAWEYKADSVVRELMADCYRDLYGKEPKIQSIHAGLECGILSGKLPGLDCISFGPDNFDIHTPQERLSISSTERVWNLIVEFLKRAK